MDGWNQGRVGLKMTEKDSDNMSEEARKRAERKSKRAEIQRSVTAPLDACTICSQTPPHFTVHNHAMLTYAAV